MADVLQMIDGLRSRLWTQYGDVLKREKSQEEVHMTYYAGELLKRRGHKWYRAKDKAGAFYSEAAMQDAFTAGRRIGQQEATEIAERLTEERLAEAQEALSRRFS